jgi:hypothetical protein
MESIPLSSTIATDEQILMQAIPYWKAMEFFVLIRQEM